MFTSERNSGTEVCLLRRMLLFVIFVATFLTSLAWTNPRVQSTARLPTTIGCHETVHTFLPLNRQATGVCLKATTDNVQPSDEDDKSRNKDEENEATEDLEDAGQMLDDTSSEGAETMDLVAKRKHVTIVGAGWAGLSAANTLLEETNDIHVTLIDASPRVGGLVRDGFGSIKQDKELVAEAGQHGFWKNYRNIYNFLENKFGKGPEKDLSEILTDYAPQGQFSPRGLEAVWPVYNEQPLPLPTGLAQLFYTQFLSLPLLDRATALPLVLAFSEFDDSPEAWKRYDEISFRDLCLRLGVSRRCYEEAFEPMILTGLFAPGRECSAAAALGMAYFFVLQSQTAFDVQWCRGNIGEKIFTPWLESMKETGRLTVECSTKVSGFEIREDLVQRVKCVKQDGDEKGSTFEVESDDVILAVGATALNAFARFCPELSAYDEFRGFANLRGTSVLATRIFLDKNVTIPYSANACWGFDKDIGMTMFDIRTLHGDDARTVKGCPGSVIEVDYYHANKLIVMTDDAIIEKVKKDLDNLLGIKCQQAQVVDAAVVRLPNGVNWYFPGSYKDMPEAEAKTIRNLYFAGDIVRTRHGSWSQEKAFVTGIEAANVVLGRPINSGVLPLASDEPHVKLGKDLVALAKSLIGGGSQWKGPSLVDFLL